MNAVPPKVENQIKQAVVGTSITLNINSRIVLPLDIRAKNTNKRSPRKPPSKIKNRPTTHPAGLTKGIHRNIFALMTENKHRWFQWQY